MEAFFMYCELNSFDVLSFYDPYSLPLAIVHSIVSAVICFAFLSLDPYKTNFEVVVIVCVGLILGGMFGNLMGIRLYFSILVNAVSFTALFVAIRYLMKREEIEIDCYGDRARVAVYKSTMFTAQPADSSSDKTAEPAPAEEASAPDKTASESTEDENKE